MPSNVLVTGRKKRLLRGRVALSDLFLSSNRVNGQDLIPNGAVLQGDAYDLIRSLRKDSVDLIITSPPYWGQRTYEQKHNWQIFNEWTARNSKESIPTYDWYRRAGGLLGLEPVPEWYISNLVEILGWANEILKPMGSIWVNLGDTYFARWASIRQKGRQGLGNNPRERRRVPMGSYRQEKQLLLIPARFAIAMQERRWILRNDLIWHKPNVPPRPEGDRLRLSHEHFMHFVKRPKEGRAKYFYDLSVVEAGARDVVTCFVRSGENGHSATFPEQLILPRILSSSPEGGIVLDPFCGTGRAVKVATANRRIGIGFEISDNYCKLTKASLGALGVSVG